MRYPDHDEIAGRLKKRARQRRRDVAWNFLTGMVIVAILALVGFFLILFSNPYVSINPFPPPTLPALAGALTQTTLPLKLPPTSTPTAPHIETPLVVALNSTPLPTKTMAPTPSQQVIIDFPDDPNRPYAIEGSPAAMANTIFHPGDGCNWQGLAGRVVDLQGRAVIGVVVRVTGIYDGSTVEVNIPTGSAAAWYGESGYEFVLGEKPLNSNASLAVQLFDAAMQPISNRVTFSTYSACDKNLVIINFRQVH